jgi:hypothetical protein
MGLAGMAVFSQAEKLQATKNPATLPQRGFDF